MIRISFTPNEPGYYYVVEGTFRGLRLFPFSPKIGKFQRGRKDASKRAAENFAAFIPALAWQQRDAKSKKKNAGKGKKSNFFGGETSITECIYRYVG